MTTDKMPSALKHGAFSKIVFLPGEDPQDYEKLEQELFAEYKPSGRSEKETLEQIAKAMWQQRRLDLYEHFHLLQKRESPLTEFELDPVDRALAACHKASGSKGEHVPLYHRKGQKTRGPVNGYTLAEIMAGVADAERSDADKLLEFGSLVTIEHLDKRLDVDNKLQSKIDRLFRRFFQMKATKPIMGLGEGPLPTPINETPLLEITASEATTIPELVEIPAVEVTATDPVKPTVE